jgi:hypothetical protein
MPSLDWLLDDAGVLSRGPERNSGEKRDEYDCDEGHFIHGPIPGIDKMYGYTVSD